MKRISVVIPSYNSARYLGDALRSCAAQTQPAHEVIVVDDGSDDDVAAACAGFDVRVLRQSNAGPAAARNQGARHATGSHLVFLDADDQLSGDALAGFASVDADLVAIGWRETDASGQPLADHGVPRFGDEPFHTLIGGNIAAIHSFCVDRAAFDAVGGFDETLRRQEDWDLWLRLTASGARCASVDGPRAIYRRLPVSNSTQLVGMLRASGAVLARAARVHPGCVVCAAGLRRARRAERRHWAGVVRRHLVAPIAGFHAGLTALRELAGEDPLALLYLFAPPRRRGAHGRP